MTAFALSGFLLGCLAPKRIFTKFRTSFGKLLEKEKKNVGSFGSGFLRFFELFFCKTPKSLKNNFECNTSEILGQLSFFSQREQMLGWICGLAIKNKKRFCYFVILLYYRGVKTKTAKFDVNQQFACFSFFEKRNFLYRKKKLFVQRKETFYTEKLFIQLCY